MIKASVWEKECAKAQRILESALGYEGRAYTVNVLAEIAAERIKKLQEELRLRRREG